MGDDIKRRDPRRRHGLCLVETQSVVVITFSVLLSLALTVFRPRQAVTTVNSVRAFSLTTDLDIPNLAVDLNVTLILNLIVLNPNVVSATTPPSSTTMAPSPAKPPFSPGEIAAKGTETMDVVLKVLAGCQIGDRQVYGDMVRGSLNVTATMTIWGKVMVLGVFKIYLVSFATCVVAVGIRNRTVENSNCSVAAVVPSCAVR